MGAERVPIRSAARCRPQRRTRHRGFYASEVDFGFCDVLSLERHDAESIRGRALEGGVEFRGNFEHGGEGTEGKAKLYGEGGRRSRQDYFELRLAPLREELKNLYVAITRARRSLVLFDTHAEKRRGMWTVFEKVRLAGFGRRDDNPSDRLAC